MADPGNASSTVRGGEASTSLKDEEARQIAEFVREQEALFQRLDELADKPVRVRQWSIEGLERTRVSIIQREMDALAAAHTFGELRETLQDLYISLDNLHIFSAIRLIADEPSEDVPHADLCDVKLRVVERQRLGIHLGGFVQGPQGSLDLKFSLANLLGFAENLQVMLEVGKEPASLLDIFSAQQFASELAVRVTRARPAARPVTVGLTIHQLGRDNLRWASWREKLRGGIATVSSEDGAHSAHYELGWRQLSDPSRCASPSVQRQLGHSLKSAVGYTWRHNTFDNPFFPTRGFGLRSQTEFAGLFADARALRYVRQEVLGQVVTGLSEGVALCLSGGAGVLLPWGAGFWGRHTPLSERFSLGGVSANLRGFHFKGVGPTDLRRRAAPGHTQNGADTDREPQRPHDHLGGDFYASLMAALRFQLPGIPPLHSAGIYGHVFVNGGSSILLSGQHKPLKQLSQEFRDTARLTAGAGLVWPIAMGSIEVDYVRLLRRQPGDEGRDGFHIGCSAELF